MQIKHTKEKKLQNTIIYHRIRIELYHENRKLQKTNKKNIEYKLKRSNIVIFDMAQNNKLSHVLITYYLLRIVINELYSINYIFSDTCT